VLCGLCADRDLRNVGAGSAVQPPPKRLTCRRGPPGADTPNGALDPNPPEKGKDPMSERSEPRVTPLRLMLDFGETVELDGSSLYDPTSDTAVPAVVLRKRIAWRMSGEYALDDDVLVVGRDVCDEQLIRLRAERVLVEQCGVAEHQRHLCRRGRHQLDPGR